MGVQRAEIKSVKIGFIRDIRVPALQFLNYESSITNWRC